MCSTGRHCHINRGLITFNDMYTLCMILVYTYSVGQQQVKVKLLSTFSLWMIIDDLVCISGKILRVIPNLQVKLIWAVKSTCNQKGYKIPLCRPGHQ